MIGLPNVITGTTGLGLVTIGAFPASAAGAALPILLMCRDRWPLKAMTSHMKLHAPNSRRYVGCHCERPFHCLPGTTVGVVAPLVSHAPPNAIVAGAGATGIITLVRVPRTARAGMFWPTDVSVWLMESVRVRVEVRPP